MANKHVKGISLNALVDKGNNRVIFAESDEDFVDVLLSFLTMAMGTIVRLTSSQPETVEIGCMNNLYESIKNLDMQRLQTEACKTMLLHPRSAAETHCRNLKLKIDNGEPTSYFFCGSFDCIATKYKLLSHYKTASCGCKRSMGYPMDLPKKESKKLIYPIREGGVFAKGLSRLIISDGLKIMPLSTAASFSLLFELGVMDGSSTEERTFDVGIDEVLNLLKCSLASKTPLTETLLKHKPAPQFGKGNFYQGYIQSQIVGEGSNGGGKICVKLLLSKSRKRVCYAEAGEDFVDMLFSFLTVPLGYIGKKMHAGSPSNGCLDQLYKSVLDLDAEQYLKSVEHKAMLVSPKLAPGFGYENQLLDIEEALHEPCYLYTDSSRYHRLATDEAFARSQNSVTVLTVLDPKSPHEEPRSGDGGGGCGRGFVKGPAMFTITDNLIITSISPISGISLLNQLKVPFSDIEERVVHVGKEEALRLLVASFVSDSALTTAFIATEPKHYE